MNSQNNFVKKYIIRRYSIDELESILNQKLNNQSRNLKHYADKSLDKFMNVVVYSITDEILEQLTDGWVEDSPIPEKGLYEFIQEIFGERIIKKYDELRSMNLQENISIQLKRRINLLDRVIDNLLPNMYPCDYNSSDHFVEGVLDEIIWFLRDEEELQGIERMDIEDYILEYKYDELTEYFNERCIVLKNDNLQESIRKILREETNDYPGFNDLSENDLYNISEWGLNGEYYYSGCNDYDDPVECGVEDFKQFLSTPWPLGLGDVPNNPIIYRIIKLKNSEDLNRTNLGHSWFSNPKQYEKDCFFDMLDHIRPNRFNDSIYLLKGKTNINNIDVPRTLWERSTQWCENEIVIINDLEIELLSVKKLN